MPDLYTEAYPYLANLIGGWFHQDFDIDGDESIEDIVAAYKKGTPADDWGGARADIKRFLRNTVADLDGEFQRVFSPGVEPAGWNMTTRQWLDRIYELL